MLFICVFMALYNVTGYDRTDRNATYLSGTLSSVQTVSKKAWSADQGRYREQPGYLRHQHLLIFRDHVHIFVGQSPPSFSSTVCFQSCQLSVRIFHIFPVVVKPSPSRPPLLLFPGTTMSIIFLEMLFSFLLLMCRYQFKLFCLRNVDIRHTLASSDLVCDMVLSGLTLYP